MRQRRKDPGRVAVEIGLIFHRAIARLNRLPKSQLDRVVRHLMGGVGRGRKSKGLFPACTRIRKLGGPIGIEDDPKGANRTGDIFDAVFAEVFEFIFTAIADVIPNPPGDADTARLGERFETRGDVDAIPENGAVFLPSRRRY